jgi:hypothetical protein
MLVEGGERWKRRVDGEPNGGEEELQQRASVEQSSGELVSGYVWGASVGDEEACSGVNLSRGRLMTAVHGE